MIVSGLGGWLAVAGEVFYFCFPVPSCCCCFHFPKQSSSISRGGKQHRAAMSHTIHNLAFAESAVLYKYKIHMNRAVTATTTSMPAMAMQRGRRRRSRRRRSWWRLASSTFLHNKYIMYSYMDKEREREWNGVVNIIITHPEWGLDAL